MMPITGSSTSAASSGSGSSARMPSVVSPSVRQTVAITPMRAPMKAQTSLPAAPPANTSVSARPTVGRLAPLAIRTNGRKIRKPMRVALSIMPIDSSTGKPKRLPRPAGAATVASCSAVARRLRPASAAPARRSRPRPQGRAAPMIASTGCHGSTTSISEAARRHRHLADVAGEIVGAERLHRARPGEGARDQRRGERMLRAGAEPADQQRDHQRPEADARAGEQIADARQRGAGRQHQRHAEPLRQQRRTESASPPWCRSSRCAAGRAPHSRGRTRPARAAA